MSEFQVVQELSWTVLGQATLVAALLLLFLGFVGLLPARLLLSGGPWSRYWFVLAPFVGWLLAITVSYYFNARWLTTTQIFWLLLGLGVIGAAVTLRRFRTARWDFGDRWIALSAIVGLVLFFIAVLPHARDDSLGLLALNVDEDLYYPYAEHLKHSPATMSGAADGPFLELEKLDRFRARGQGFVYTLSLASIVSGTPTFLAYMPTIYLLLGLSVVSVFLFARVGLQLGPRTSFLAAGLYGLNGLPLWFSSMGFGPHTVAFAFMPLAFGAVIAAIRHGGVRPAILAGWVSAGLLSSYFWGISGMFAATAAPLALILALAKKPRANRIRTVLIIGLVGVATGFPGLFHFAKWAVARFTVLTSDLNKLFGNAWGDITFPAPRTSTGIRAYHMVNDPEGMERLLGTHVWSVLQSLELPAWIGFIALAIVALAKMRGEKLPALILAAAFAAFGLWVRLGAGYQYGYFKTLSYVAFFGDTLLAAGLAVAWTSIGRPAVAGWPRAMARYSAMASLRVLTAAALLLVGALTAVNTVQTFRWYWTGFTWNMPSEIVHEARQIARSVPEGSTVRLSPHFQYPLVPGSTKFRPITLAFHFESHAQNLWNARTAAILGAEMYGRNYFTAGRTPGFPQNIRKMPPDPDFVILGSHQDARIHGLLRSENLTPEGTLGLYRYRPADIIAGAQVAESFDGSNFFTRARPFNVTVAADAISADPEAVSQASGASRRLLLGVLNPATVNAGVSVEIDGQSTDHVIAPGLHWIVSDLHPVPYTVIVTPHGYDPVQMVLARALDADADVDPSVTPDARAVISVRVRTDGQKINATVSFANPSRQDLEAGVTYQESNTHGFWVSGLGLPSTANLIELEYSVAERKVTEAVDDRILKTGFAREFDFRGTRRFEIVFGAGAEVLARLILFEYRYLDDQVTLRWTPSEPYVFHLPSR
ncbi:MAG: hypothetical protein OXG46_10055 [Chloroflexi bacterium]|nr:hypothetical protein [Chloroflexota bacterium]MCY3937359.1 hypothetical protein [Chloroflexota bacterium]